MSGVIAGAALKLKPITPKPERAAFSYVGGLPAACHIGGCGFFHGFGSTLRVGTLKYSPSNE